MSHNNNHNLPVYITSPQHFVSQQRHHASIISPHTLDTFTDAHLISRILLKVVQQPPQHTPYTDLIELKINKSYNSHRATNSL